MFVRAIATGVLFSMAFGPASIAAAQQIWLPIEVEASGVNGASVPVVQVADALRRRGQSVMSPVAAATEVTRRHSRPAVRPSEEQLAQYDTNLRGLADHIASEDLDATMKALQTLAAAGPDALDVLNRQADRARRRFNICLLTGRLISKFGKSSDGLEHVKTCARDFPGFEPDNSRYLPPSMRSFFAQAQRKLHSIKPAALRIELAGPAQEGCHALINGMDKGAVPATADDLRTESVRVQVECGPNLSRIHEVALHSGQNAIAIDPGLDQALASGPSLKLKYDDRARMRELAPQHGIAIGRALRVDFVVELSGNELRRIDIGSEKPTAIVLVRGSLDAAVADLIAAGASPSAEVAMKAAQTHEPAPAASVPAPEAAQALASAERRSELPAPAASPAQTSPEPADVGHSLRTLGWVGVGGAALAVGAAVFAWRVREGAIADYNSCVTMARGKPASEVAGLCNGHYQSYMSAHNAEVGSLIAAGAFAGLSTLFFVLDANHGSSTEPVDTAARCTPGPGDLGVACALHF